MKLKQHMLSPRGLSAGIVALGIAFASSGYADDIFKAKLYPDKKGVTADFQPMSKFCGTKPIKVAYSDGWGGNYWRHLARAEFEDEASKCKNITNARYTDGEFKPEKQIADIEGLVAQKYDVIVAQLDGGAAILKATREATAAGVAVVPDSTGDNFAGKVGKDYVSIATESQIPDSPVAC
jgi:ribose transport system substrate-binding protein